jgi:hypothetical protein
LVERTSEEREVIGSNPIVGTGGTIVGFANMGTDLDDLAAIACVEKYHAPTHAIEVVAVARPQTCPYCGGTPNPNTFLSRWRRG